MGLGTSRCVGKVVASFTVLMTSGEAQYCKQRNVTYFNHTVKTRTLLVLVLQTFVLLRLDLGHVFFPGV